jgi:hypothetical protein
MAQAREAKSGGLMSHLGAQGTSSCLLFHPVGVILIHMDKDDSHHCILRKGKENQERFFYKKMFAISYGS